MRPPPQEAASQRPKEQIRRITRTTGHILVGTGETTAAGNEYAMTLARRREGLR